MEKKRFVLFGYNHNFPTKGGGMNDALTSFDTFEELSKEISKDDKEEFSYLKVYEWNVYQVFDTKTFNEGEGETPFQAYFEATTAEQ